MRSGETPVKFGRFVGRERELGELRHALDETRDGRGRLFLISGESGVGKTRLAEEIAREAAVRGMLAVWGRCWEGAGAPAYWPWIQVIRGCINSANSAQRHAVLESEHASSRLEAVAKIVPELLTAVPRSVKPIVATRLDPAEAQFRLFDSIATLLKDFARLKPLAIVFDDLQDADYSSLSMLRFVARELAGVALLIIGTYREVEVRRSPELSKHIGDLGREAHSIPLGGLSEGEVAQFVAFSSGQTTDEKLVSRLYAATDGNPLFVDGIVRIMIADGGAGHKSTSNNYFKIPDSLREAIRRRLAALSDESNSLLASAAAVGKEFDASVLQKASSAPVEEVRHLLDEAAAAGIVNALGKDRYRFSHALIRDSVYGGIDTNRRVKLHALLGETLEEMHTNKLQGHCAELAHHFKEAGISKKAIYFLQRAGQEAWEALAFEETFEHLCAATELMEESSSYAEKRADLLEVIANLAFYIDETLPPLYLERAIKAYEAVDRQNRVVVINSNLACRFATPDRLLDISRALEHVQRAEAALREDTPPHDRARIDDAIAQVAARTFETQKGFAASARAMEEFDSDGDHQMWSQSAIQHACHLIRAGRLAEGFALMERAWQAAERSAAYTWGAAWSGALYCRLLGDPHAALAWLDRELAKRRTTLSQRLRTLVSGVRCEQLVLLGNLREARQAAPSLSEEPVILHKWVELFEGKWEDAEQRWTEQLNWHLRKGSRAEGSGFLPLLVWVRRLLKDHHANRALLEDTLAICRNESLQLVEMVYRPEIVLLCTDMGQGAEAKPHLERCREIMAEGEDWRGLVGSVARAEAVIAADGAAAAEIQFEKAVQINRRYQVPFEEAETLYYWGRALIERDKYSDANEKFAAAIEIYRRHCAGERWIDRVEQARLRPQSSPNTAHSQTTSSTSADENIFRKDGDFWTVTHRGKTFRLRNSKGLEYIAYLLAHPGVRVHACDLVSVIEGGEAGSPGASPDRARAEGLQASHDLGDAGDTLDPQAISAYRQRLTEVRAELADAERNNDSGAVERGRHEYELLTAQLSAGVGRRGRIRRNSSHVERARTLVTKNIRAGVERIRRSDGKLGDHFATSIHTGAFCFYLPDHETKPSWQM
jgi:predicted ATPase